MVEEFVSYEQAKALREFGFNEMCFGFYSNTVPELMMCKNGEPWMGNGAFAAPLKQQVFRWFREKYGFDFYITRMLPNTTNRDVYHIVLNDLWAPNDSYKNYEDAESRLVDNLIELGKYQDK